MLFLNSAFGQKRGGVPLCAFLQRLSPRQAKLLIGGLIILAVLAAWGVLNVGRSFTYYLTIRELRAQGPSPRRVRVSGRIVGESIQWHPEALELIFEIADGEDRLPVRYHGSRPDMLRDGAEAVVEGRYLPDGHFEADQLLLKCPSKYQEKASG
jgi:cytochrome c-type biogenesis protein CcmE